MTDTKANQALRWILLAYFALPAFLFLFIFKFEPHLDISELVWALKNAVLQAASAALICVVLSIRMALGLFCFSKGLSRWLQRLLLLPQVFPALFTLLIAFTILKPFPMGPIGVVFVYVLINLGLTVLLTYFSIAEKIGDLASVSQVYGLSRFTFLRKVFFPLLWTDLLNHFFLIFIFCLSSFSVPLMAGGGKGTNLEVLIYEKIFIGQDWSGAFTLALLQSAGVFVLGFLFLKRNSHHQAPSTTQSYLRSCAGAVSLLIYLLIYLGGYFVGLAKSLSAFHFFSDFAADLIQSSLFSLASLLCYMIWSLFLLLLWIWDYIAHDKINPAINLLYASTVTVGFSFYLLFPLDKQYDSFKLVFAMSILLFPTMFKLFIEPALLGMKEQIQVAKIFGLKTTYILYDVIFLQLQQRALWGWLSFSVMWFLSDYAVSRAIGLQTQSLGLLSESFLGSYRLSLGYLMSFYIFILSLFAVGVLYLMLRLGDVFYKKLTS